jgi:hypothetical protein
MQMKATCRIRIEPGDKEGTLVAVPTLIDSEGNELAQFKHLPVVDGSTLDLGPFFIEFKLMMDSMLTAGKGAAARSTTSEAIAAAKQAATPTPKR